MEISYWLIVLPVGPGTAGALRQIRVGLNRLPSRQERTCRSHARHDRSDQRHKARICWSQRRTQEPDRNPLAESAGGPTMTLGFCCLRDIRIRSLPLDPIVVTGPSQVLSRARVVTTVGTEATS